MKAKEHLTGVQLDELYDNIHSIQAEITQTLMLIHEWRDSSVRPVGYVEERVTENLLSASLRLQLMLQRHLPNTTKFVKSLRG